MTEARVPVTDDAHPDDIAVDRFAAQMKAKLAAARAKGRGGWDDPVQCSIGYLRQLMHEHVAKGDPVDVANFCMMLANYGASTAITPVADPAMEGVVAKAVRESLWRLCGVDLKLSASRKVAEGVLSAICQMGEG